MSPKQQKILAHVRQHGSITTQEATSLVGDNLYANAAFHVGQTLSRMVFRGMLRRVKPGYFVEAKGAPQPVNLELR